jgi:hypothetical protein
MKRIILKGRIPSKKNSKQIVCRGRFPLVLPSRAYEVWHEEKMWELKAQRIGRIEKVSKIEIVIFAPDVRKSDLTNKAESLMDLLVDAEIIEDDNWFVCPEVNIKFGGVDRENYRGEIKIYEQKDNNSI